MHIVRILTAATFLLVIPVSGLLYILSASIGVAAASALLIILWVVSLGFRSAAIIGASLAAGEEAPAPANQELLDLVQRARDRLEQAAWQRGGSREPGLSGLRFEVQTFESSRALVFSVRNLPGTEMKIFFSKGAVARLSEAALTEAATLAVLDASRSSLGVRCWAAALVLSALKRIPLRAVEVFWALLEKDCPASDSGLIERNEGAQNLQWALSPVMVLLAWVFLPWLSMLLGEVEGVDSDSVRIQTGAGPLSLIRLEKGQSIAIERALLARARGGRGPMIALAGLFRISDASKSAVRSD